MKNIFKNEPAHKLHELEKLRQSCLTKLNRLSYAAKKHNLPENHEVYRFVSQSRRLFEQAGEEIEAGIDESMRYI